MKPEVLDASLRLPSSIQGRGVPVAPLRAPLSTFWHAALLPRERGYAELRRAMAIFTAGAAGYARQIRALLLRFPADVIVADYTFFGAWLAADLARVPFVAAYHSGLPFPVPGAPPFGSGLPLRAARDARWDAAAGELAGLVRLDTEAVRAALERLRAEPSFAERARGIAEALRGVDGIEAAAASLREIAGAGRRQGR